MDEFVAIQTRFIMPPPWTSTIRQFNGFTNWHNCDNNSAQAKEKTATPRGDNSPIRKQEKEIVAETIQGLS